MPADTQGTCQVCFHTQKLPSGLLAFHGFRRPGDGTTYGRCPGTGYPPFEVSCERTKWYLEAAILHDLQNAIRDEEQLRADPGPATILYAQRFYNRQTYRTETRSTPVTRGAPEIGIRYTDGWIPSYESLRQNALRTQEATVRALRQLADDYRAKIASWAPGNVEAVVRTEKKAPFVATCPECGATFNGSEGYGSSGRRTERRAKLNLYVHRSHKHPQSHPTLSGGGSSGPSERRELLSE